MQSLDISRREIARVSVPEALDLVQDQQVGPMPSSFNNAAIIPIVNCSIQPSEQFEDTAIQTNHGPYTYLQMYTKV